MLRDPKGATDLLQTDLGQSVWPARGVEPNTLFPDGAYIQPGHGPSYRAAGNLPDDADLGDHGVLSYWVKMTVSPWPDPPMRPHFLCVRYDGSNTQVLCAVDASWPASKYNGILAENWADPGDVRDPGHERVCARFGQFLHPDARWCLATALYDTDQTLSRHEVDYQLQGVFPVQSTDQAYQGTKPFSTTGIQKLTLDTDLTFCIGGEILGNWNGKWWHGYPNQVMDEFAVLDFGDDFDAAQTTATTWSRLLFRDGRYYKGGDGAFLSAPLSPDAGRPVRLLAVSWTERSPLESRLLLRGTFGTIPRMIDPVLVDATGKARVRVDLDLLDPDGALDARDGDPVLLRHLVQGGPAGVVLGRFRYRVRFPTDLVHPADDPLLETPFLDDVTFAWQSLSGPRILAWRRGD